MDIESLRDYCLNMPDVTESFPFDETTLVFKVNGKMFLLTDLEGQFSMNVKCEPEKAAALREQYACVLPGYHMNKQHWNTVIIDGSVSDKILTEWIIDSYNMVKNNKSRKSRKA